MLKKQDNVISSHIAAERAIDELRRQMGIIIQRDNNYSWAIYPVEFLSEEMLSALRSLPSTCHLVLTGARARSIGIEPGSARTMRLPAETLSLAQIQALANPLAPQTDLTAIKATEIQDIDFLLLKLAKYASLLPALLVIQGKGLGDYALLSHWHTLTLDHIKQYIKMPLLELLPAIQASLPIEDAENSKIFAFQGRYSSVMHLALVVGDIPSNDAPLTRIHSSCVTGDILGSLRCDCGDQLALALKQIKQAKQGILIYLYQEGRGIGIANKLRAYQLQENGYDTYDANLMLGFEEDERDFTIAAAILKQLGFSSIHMLTNNPRKITAMENAGINVKERVPLVTEAGRHNHAYLDAKGKKAGHLL